MSDLQRIPRLLPKPQAHQAGSLAASLTGQAGGTLSAPAHPFDESTGSGILWSPAALELWLNGERLDVAEVETESPLDCWRDLAFVRAFPNVTHWWFGSIWTQRVWATAMAQQPDGSCAVWLQAVQKDSDELLWVVQADGLASGQMPEFAGGEANLTLQLRLGQLARLVLAGELALNHWAAVTSLVTANELPALLTGDQGNKLLIALGLT